MPIKRKILVPLLIFVAVTAAAGLVMTRLQQKGILSFGFAGIFSAVFITVSIALVIITAVRVSAYVNDRFDKFHRDVQTGVFNRYYFDENVDKLIQSLSRSGGILSFMVVDIDFFKQFNDKYGDFIVDECLSNVAAAITRVSQPGDIVARYSSDKFVAAMPNVTAEAARVIAFNILENVRDLGMAHEASSAADHVTVSIGVTAGHADYHQSVDDYTRRAGELLYASKHAGRDRFTFGGFTLADKDGRDDEYQEHEQIRNQHLRRTAMVRALADSIEKICLHNQDTFAELMTDAVKPVAYTLGVDCLNIYRACFFGGKLRLRTVCRWKRLGDEPGNAVYIDENSPDSLLPESVMIPEWIEAFKNGGVVNKRLSDMPASAQSAMSEYGVQSVYFSPIFLRGEFWGVADIQSHGAELYFAEDSVESDLIQIAANIFANAAIRNETEQKLHEAQERLTLMLDASPLCCQLWDKDMIVFDCNLACVEKFGFKDKQEYCDRFFELSPERQPDGQLSDEKAMYFLGKTFQEGRSVFDWTHLHPDGTEFPAEVTLARVKYGENNIVAGYIRDLREYEAKNGE